MERRIIEIPGIKDPGFERWGLPKSEVEKLRCQKIIQRLDEEYRDHPGCSVSLRYKEADQFELSILTPEDLAENSALEKRFEKVMRIKEHGREAFRRELRKIFLY